MALLIKAEALKGLISVTEAIAAVREGFRDQGEKPAYSAPRIRLQHEDRRVSVHPGGCHRLHVAGMFIHVERFTFHGGAQQYEKAGKRVYVAYDSETARLKTIIVGSLPLFDEPPQDWFGTETAITSAVGTDILARPDCRTLALTAPAGRRAGTLWACARSGPRSKRSAYSAAAPRTGLRSLHVCNRRCARGSLPSRRRRPPRKAPISSALQPAATCRCCSASGLCPASTSPRSWPATRACVCRVRCRGRAANSMTGSSRARTGSSPGGGSRR